MPRCPKCDHALANAPEDAREWFRCESCGAGLRLPTSFSKALFWLCVFGPFFGLLILADLLGKYFHLRISIGIALDGSILAVYAAATRLMWKTKWSRPQLYDPYSTFNFTESAKKPR